MDLGSTATPISSVEDPYPSAIHMMSAIIQKYCLEDNLFEFLLIQEGIYHFLPELNAYAHTSTALIYGWPEMFNKAAI
jgi:hypothetical protein